MERAPAEPEEARLALLAPAGLIALVAATYLAINLALPSLFTSFVAAYVVRPALWVGVALVAFLLWRRSGLRFSGSLVPASLLLGVGQVSLFAIAGIFIGFGFSPYDHTPWGVLINIVFVGSALVGMELSRAYLLHRLGKGSPLLALALIALLYAVVDTPLVRLVSLAQGAPQEAVPFVASGLFPSLAESLLASYLALTGGPLAAIAYRGVVAAFEWFSPILPDLPWTLKALLGTSLPIVGLLVMEGLSPPEARPAEAEGERRKGSPVMGWLVVGVAGLALMWFSLGLLPVQAMLVGGGSMEPHMYLGDVAVVRKVSGDSVAVGDVVQYKHEGTMVLHRVIAVSGEGGAKAFITKGDNNNVADAEPVPPSQVVGRLLFVVPKLGWIAIAARQPVGLVVLVAVPAALVVASTAWSFGRRRMAKRQSGSTGAEG